MPFVFSVEKAIQVAGYLLSLQPDHKMPKKKLLAMLYMAERESLRTAGHPMIGGPIVATDDGPTLETIAQLIEGREMKNRIRNQEAKCYTCPYYDEWWNDEEAEDDARDALQCTLGRDPTEEEMLRNIDRFCHGTCLLNPPMYSVENEGWTQPCVKRTDVCGEHPDFLKEVDEA